MHKTHKQPRSCRFSTIRQTVSNGPNTKPQTHLSTNLKQGTNKQTNEKQQQQIQLAFERTRPCLNWVDNLSVDTPHERVIIILIKRICRAPTYCTRWECRVLYNNANNSHMHTHTHTHTRVHACKHICMHACPPPPSTHTHTNNTHSHIHTHTHACIYTHMHVRTHTHTHMSYRGIGTAAKKMLSNRIWHVYWVSLKSMLLTLKRSVCMHSACIPEHVHQLSTQLRQGLSKPLS